MIQKCDEIYIKLYSSRQSVKKIANIRRLIIFRRTQTQIEQRFYGWMQHQSIFMIDIIPNNE